MVIKEKIVNGLSVLCLNGKLDIFSKNTLKETAEHCQENGAKGLILDMQGITFVDSIGLGMLVIVAKSFQKLKGRLIVVNPQEQIHSQFLQMKLGKMIPMYKTDDSYSQFAEL